MRLMRRPYLLYLPDRKVLRELLLEVQREEDRAAGALAGACSRPNSVTAARESNAAMQRQSNTVVRQCQSNTV